MPDLVANNTNNGKIFEKYKFSMCIDEVNRELKSLGNIENIILTGIETHVCVLQTCFDLIDKGYNIHLCVDAIGSQREIDKKTAVDVCKCLNICCFRILCIEFLVFCILQ